MSPSEQDFGDDRQFMMPKGMEVGGLSLIRDILRASSEEGLSLGPIVKLFLDVNAHLAVSVTEDDEILIEFLEGQPILKLLMGLKTAKVTSLRINDEKVLVSIDGLPDFELDVVE